MIVLQEPDAFNKVRRPDYHHQVYGIEVFLTTEASGQICLRIYGGVKFLAQGAKKTKMPLRNPGRNAKCLINQCVNRNVIAQSMQFVIGKAAFCHFNQPDQVCVAD
jgi:hypothetical protein